MTSQPIHAKEAGRTLEGLSQKWMWMSHAGCLIGCAEYLKMGASPAWGYGGTGLAFAMNVHKEMCPSGPCAWEDNIPALSANLGLVLRPHFSTKRHDDFAAAREGMWEEAKKAIDAGLPCYGYDLDVPEFYVIHGYDGEGNYVFRKFGGTAAKYPHDKLGESHVGVAFVMVASAGKAAEDRVTVREALRWAVEHSSGKKAWKDYSGGLAGYDAWIKAMKDDAVAGKSGVGFGNSYNAQCWAEARRHAEAFLREAKARLKDEKLAPLLDQAAGQYKTVADNLSAVAKTFPFSKDDEKAMDERMRDPALRQKAAAWLAAAKDAEAAGVGVLAKVVEALDAAGKGGPQAGAPAPMGGIDYSRLDLKGHGHTQDSFALAVCAAAGLLGRPAEYEAVCAMSSNCFAPAIDKGEDCTAWWHVQGWQADRAMETVAARLGLKAERLRMPPKPLAPAEPKDQALWKAVSAKIIREAMASGAVVLIDGGWKVGQAGGFVPWCWWGIITRADDDGTILGATIRAQPGRKLGAKDHPLDYLGGCWAVTKAEPRLDDHAADRKMLEQAVERIRGQAAFKAEGRAVFGLEAMDLWIAAMSKAPFCGPCQKSAGRAWTCATSTGETAMAAAKVAASCLRARKAAWPEKAQGHIQAAAGHYDKIIELLTPAVRGKGEVHYAAFIGDLAKQQAHAKVLERVKAELAAAGDEMSKVLAAQK